MAGQIAGSPPDAWPGGWYPAGIFYNAAQTSVELRNWLKPGLDPRLQSFVWWAAATDREGFALLYHQSAAQLGFWLSPGLRGRGRGKVILKRALGELPADRNTLVLATVARENPAAYRIAHASGMRVIAEQKRMTLFGLYRNLAHVI